MDLTKNYNEVSHEKRIILYNFFDKASSIIEISTIICGIPQLYSTYMYDPRCGCHQFQTALEFFS